MEATVDSALESSPHTAANNCAPLVGVLRRNMMRGNTRPATLRGKRHSDERAFEKPLKTSQKTSQKISHKTSQNL